MSDQDSSDNKVLDKGKHCAVYRYNYVKNHFYCISTIIFLTAYLLNVNIINKHTIFHLGAIMTELAERLLNVKKCNFMPDHKNNLANEFYCYSNFDFDKTLE